MAIQVIAGEPLRQYLTSLNDDGTPRESEVLSVVFSERPDNEPIVPAGDTTIFTNEGNGVYSITIPTNVGDPAGEWYILIQNEDGTQWQQTWDVSATRPVQQVIQPITTVGGHTRQSIRRMAAQDLGDFHLVRATATGTQSSVVSTYDLRQEQGHFKGMQVYCSAGTAQNVGMTGTVTVSDQATSSIAFSPPFPQLTAEGDEFELYNMRGIGWQKEEYDRAINAAILRAGDEHATIPYVVTLDTVFSRTNPYLTIPAEFSHFSGVEVVERNGRRRLLPHKDLDVDTFGREVRLDGRSQYDAHGRTLRIRGYRRPPTLESDDATTSIPVEWIVHEVMAQLLQQSVSTGSSQGARDRLFYMERQGADGRRPSIVGTFAPNTIRLHGGILTEGIGA